MALASDSRKGQRIARKRDPYLFLALFLSLLAAMPLLIGRGVVNTRAGGDSPFLLQRVHQLTQNLRAGVFPARWMPDGAHGLGYPFFNFYAAFPYYVAATLNLAGCGVLWGMKLTQTLGFAGAGVSMYLLARKIGVSPAAALLASACYTFTPYHLVNAYVRGDSLSELYAFALYPTVLWAVLRLRERPSPEHIALLGGTSALLMSTHNISAMIFAPLLGLWLAGEALIPARRRGWRVLATGALALGLGLLLSSWYWAPALRERSLVQLEEQTTGYFHYAGHFRSADLVQWRPIHDYSIGPEHDPFSMGLVQTGLAVAGTIALVVQLAKRRPQDVSRFLAVLSMLIYGWMMTPSSRWVWAHVPLLPYVQFPWRLLSVQALGIALVASNVPDLWQGPWARSVALGLATMAAVGGMAGLRIDRLPLSEADVNRQRLMLYETFSGNIGTTVRHEYLPRWMVPRPYTSAVQLNDGEKPSPLVLEGRIAGARLLGRGPHAEDWEIEVSDPSLLAFHTTFYPGWEATIDGVPQGVEPLLGLGLVGLRLQPGTHQVKLRFTDSPIRRYSARASLVGLLFWMALALYPCRCSRRHRGRALGLLGAVAVVAIFMARAVSEPPSVADQAGGPLVMDLVRAPYLHREPDGVWLGEAHLIDCTISASSAKPGEDVRIGLIWQEAPADHQATIQMVGATAHLFEPSLSWARASATIMSDQQTELILELPEDIPPGIYVPRLLVHKDGQLQTPRTSRGIAMGTLALAPVRVLPSRWATGEEEVLGHYGPERAPPVIALVGVDAARRSKRSVEVWLTWRSERQAPLNYMLSLRLRRADGPRVATRDLPPLSGGYPTSLWSPGELITDRVLLSTSEATMLAGDYELEIVLYDRVTLKAVGTATVDVRLS